MFKKQKDYTEITLFRLDLEFEIWDNDTEQQGCQQARAGKPDGGNTRPMYRRLAVLHVREENNANTRHSKEVLPQQSMEESKATGDPDTQRQMPRVR